MPFSTVIIHWTGPYNLSQLKDEGNREKGNGIYLLTGRRKYERTSQLQYCGITERTFYVRLNEPGHHIGEVRPSTLEIWLGEVVYPKEFDRDLLELAEHCFVHFSDIQREGKSKGLNKAKLTRPKHAICFVSQWFKPNNDPRRRRSPIFKNLPDVVWWDKERWRTGRLTIWPDEISE